MSGDRKTKDDFESKQDWLDYLTMLWYEFVNCTSDTKRFEEMIKAVQGTVSLRSLKTYKQELKWERPAEEVMTTDMLMRIERAAVKERSAKKAPKKVKISPRAKKSIKSITRKLKPVIPEAGEELARIVRLHEETGMPIISRTGNGGYYTEHERDEVVRVICDTYAIGLYTIWDVCDAQGLAYKDFFRWINQYENYNHLWQEASMRKDAAIVFIVDEGLKQHLVRNMKREKVEEIHQMYEFRLGINEEGEFIQERVLVAEKVVLKDNKLDAKILEQLRDLLKDIRHQLKQRGIQQMDKLEHMSMEELMEAIEDERKQLLTMREKNNLLNEENEDGSTEV